LIDFQKLGVFPNPVDSLSFNNFNFQFTVLEKKVDEISESKDYYLTLDLDYYRLSRGTRAISSLIMETTEKSVSARLQRFEGGLWTSLSLVGLKVPTAELYWTSEIRSVGERRHSGESKLRR
jgi:hypothetical protein